MDDYQKLACFYVAFLRGIYLLNQNFHWITSGNNFYGNHLLFERIYKSAESNADLAAEKFVEAKNSSNLIQSSLKLEERFQELSEKLYECLESQGKLTLGLDDAIMSIASDRETSIYLLKQVLKG